jgi:hypothetical protein
LRIGVPDPVPGKEEKSSCRVGGCWEFSRCRRSLEGLLKRSGGILLRCAERVKAKLVEGDAMDRFASLHSPPRIE